VKNKLCMKVFTMRSGRDVVMETVVLNLGHAPFQSQSNASLMDKLLLLVVVVVVVMVLVAVGQGMLAPGGRQHALVLPLSPPQSYHTRGPPLQDIGGKHSTYISCIREEGNTLIDV
jgi:hypothetical protein